MCKYYAHAYACKHVTFILADFCPPAGRIQTPCGTVQVWQTIKLEDPCDKCESYQYPEKPWKRGGHGRK